MMKNLTFLLFYLSFSIMQLSGQIMVDSISKKVNLVGNKNVKVLRTGIESTFNSVKQNTRWKPYDSTYNASSKTAVWLKFDMENASKDTIKSYLLSFEHYTTIYLERKDGFKQLKSGFYVPLKERANQSEKFFTELSLLPLQKAKVYVSLNSNNLKVGNNNPAIFSERGYWQYSNNNFRHQANAIGFIYFYIISLITIFIFALVFWLRLREKLYFHYLGYLFFQLIYGFLILRQTIASVGNLFEYAPKFAFSLIEPAQFGFIGFYIMFTIHLLKVKNYDRLLSKILYYLAIAFFIYAISRFIFSYFFFDAEYTSIIFLAIRLVVLPINLILIVWIIYKVKHPLLVYFIIGQSFFFIAAMLSTYVSYSGMNFIPGHLFNFQKSPDIIFMIGLLAEVYCFSLALGKNVFLIQKEKVQANTKLINQLEENQHLQETMNRELDEKVQKKTVELIKLYSEIEREREQKIKDDFNKKLKETEMIALRSQMNPHFIFNSMNAIKNLIMTTRNDDAISYLDDFASLLRGILQNSNREKITVEEELEFLELYLSLEKSRMGKGFNYFVQVTSKEELSQYQIPPLLLQPIVENAIWHGLHPSLKSEKNLIIVFDTTKDLKIRIEDNGIGRKKSKMKPKLHNSMGTSIVEDRLTLYNHLNDHTIYYKVTDLEEDGRVLGTRTTLTYKY